MCRISKEWKLRVQETAKRLRAEKKEKLTGAAAEGGPADGVATAGGAGGDEEEDSFSMGSDDNSSGTIKTRILPTTRTTEPSPAPLGSDRLKDMLSKIIPSSSSATKPTSASSSATIDLDEHDIIIPMAAIDSDSPPFADDYAKMDVETQPSSSMDEAQKGEADDEEEEVDVLDSLYNAKGVLPSRGGQYFDTHNKGRTSTDDSQGETKDDHAVPTTTTSTTGSIMGLIKQAAVAGIGLGNKVLDLFSSPSSALDTPTVPFVYTVDGEDDKEDEDIGVLVNPPRPHTLQPLSNPTPSNRLNRHTSDITIAPVTATSSSDINLRQPNFTTSASTNKVQCDNSDETKKHSEKKKHKKIRAETHDNNNNTIDCSGSNNSQDSTRARSTPPPDSYTLAYDTNTNTNVYTEEDDVNSSNKKPRKH